MIKATGVLRYSRTENYGWRLVVDIDPGISMFYRSLIPKWLGRSTLDSPVLNYGTRAKPHVTVVRRDKPSTGGQHNMVLAPRNYSLFIFSTTSERCA